MLEELYASLAVQCCANQMVLTEHRIAVQKTLGL